MRINFVIFAMIGEIFYTYVITDLVIGLTKFSKPVIFLIFFILSDQDIYRVTNVYSSIILKSNRVFFMPIDTPKWWAEVW